MRNHSSNIRRFPGRVEAQYEVQQATVSEAQLAREERNERIDDAVGFDDYLVTPEAGAVIDAALRADRIEDVYEVFNTLRLAREAAVRARISEADRKEALESGAASLSIARALTSMRALLVFCIVVIVIAFLIWRGIDSKQTDHHDHW